MAGLPLKPDMETTSDADWLIASKRAGALEALLAGSTPAVVAEVARELKLGPAMVYDLKITQNAQTPQPAARALCLRPYKTSAISNRLAGLQANEQYHQMCG